MMTEPITQGHAGASGKPTNGSNTRATTPAPTAMSDVVETVSIAPLMAAFQPAWQAAANRTAAKTKGSISSVRLEDVVQHEMHELGRDHEYEQQEDPFAR